MEILLLHFESLHALKWFHSLLCYRDILKKNRHKFFTVAKWLVTEDGSDSLQYQLTLLLQFISCQQSSSVSLWNQICMWTRHKHISQKFLNMINQLYFVFQNMFFANDLFHFERKQTNLLQILNDIACKDNYKKTKYRGLLSFSCLTVRTWQGGSQEINFICISGLHYLCPISWCNCLWSIFFSHRCYCSFAPLGKTPSKSSFPSSWSILLVSQPFSLKELKTE